MDTELQILIVYDNAEQAGKLAGVLAQTMQAARIEKVPGEEGLGSALRKRSWDAIVYACAAYAAAEGIVFFTRKFSPNTPLIAITASSDMDLAVALMKMGVSNCVPWNSVDNLATVIHRELEHISARQRAAGSVSPNTRDTMEDFRLLHAFQTAILNSLPFMAWLKDLDSRYVMVNETFARCCGLEKSELVLGKTDVDLWPRDLALLYQSDDRKVLESMQALSVEEEIMTVSGRRWADICKVPVLDANGELIGTAGFARDISSNKEYEDALVNYSSLMSATLDALSEGILLIDLEGHIVFANRSCYEIWNITDQMHAGMDDDQILQLASSRLADPESLLNLVQEANADRARESRGLLELKDGRIIQRHSQPVWKDGQLCGRVLCFTPIFSQEPEDSPRS